MARQISDIMTDMSQMTDDQIREKINELRRTRNLKPKVSSKAKDRPSSKSKKDDVLISLLAGMSEEERNKLLGMGED